MTFYNAEYNGDRYNFSAKNSIYIDPSPGQDDLLHVVVGSLLATGVTITLNVTASQSASKENYHFKIRFLTGDLSNPTNIVLAPDWALDWDVCVDTSQEQGVYVYVLRKNGVTLAPGQTCTLTLQNVGAASKTGPRSSTVYFNFNDGETYVSMSPPPPPPWGGNSVVEIINFTRKQSPPLSVALETTNMVLCDGSHQNYLLLRIVNQGPVDIDLDPDQCRFTLSFDVSDSTDDLWALATQGQVNSFYIPGKPDSSGEDPNWPSAGSWQIQQQSEPLEWQVEPLQGITAFKAGEVLEIPISNIVTGHAIGRSLLHVQYQGLNGYSDGEFTVEIEKTPLLYSSGAIDFSPTDGERLKLYNDDHTIGVQEYTTYFRSTRNFAFYEGGSYASGELDPGGGTAMVVIADGKVGIGTTSPSAQLDVRGDAAVSGKLDVSSDATFNGDLDFSTALGQKLNLWNTSYGIGVQSDTLYLRTGSNFAFYQGGQHSDTALDPGGGTAVMVIADGKVGIGTTSPAESLHVQGGNFRIDGYLKSWGAFELYANVDQSPATEDLLRLYDMNSNAVLTVTSNGNVGFGTTSPAERIHVQGGNFRIDGDLKSWGAFELYANVDQSPATEDLLHLYDMNSKAVLGVQHDGTIQIKGGPAMMYRSYTSHSNAPTFFTNVSYSDWIACLVGFDGQGDNTCKGVRALVQVVDGQWTISASVHGPYDNYWAVQVLFIRRELCSDYEGC